MDFAFYLAQGLGAIGFLLIFLAPLMRTRAKFLQLDIAGLIPVAIHYAVLGAPIGALLCALYIAMDLVANGNIKHWGVERGYWAFYVIAAAVTLAFYSSPRDMLALLGTVIAIASRKQQNLQRLNLLVFFSAIAWGAYGYLTQSIGQVVFSVFYMVSSLVGAFASDKNKRPPPV